MAIHIFNQVKNLIKAVNSVVKTKVFALSNLLQMNRENYKLILLCFILGVFICALTGVLLAEYFGGYVFDKFLQDKHSELIKAHQNLLDLAEQLDMFIDRIESDHIKQRQKKAEDQATGDLVDNVINLLEIFAVFIYRLYYYKG